MNRKLPMNTTLPNKNLIILILGILTTVTPLSIDMYLPAFGDIAQDLHTTTATLSLSISSYFIGLAAGQLFYGPLLDRFGRRKPLYVGLTIFMLASVGCVFAQSVEQLIAFRFLQALGGCSAQVGSMTMVRDFFAPKEIAKVISLLILVLSVSPLLAPSIGGLLASSLGWQSIFIVLILIVIAVITIIFFYLPKGYQADPTVSLRFGSIIYNYFQILKEPRFHTYALAGALSMTGLFVYIAASPIIFMDVFQVSKTTYGIIFALLSLGFIGASQINAFLSKRAASSHIFQTALIAQMVIAALFLIGTMNNWYGLYLTFGFIFMLLACLGFTYPNAAAIALTPFTRNIGSASALIGFLQIGIASIVSSGIGFLASSNKILPAAILMAAMPFVGFIILMVGKRNIPKDTAFILNK